jgi:hypothetical protein
MIAIMITAKATITITLLLVQVIVKSALGQSISLADSTAYQVTSIDSMQSKMLRLERQVFDTLSMHHEKLETLQPVIPPGFPGLAAVENIPNDLSSNLLPSADHPNAPPSMPVRGLLSQVDKQLDAWGDTKDGYAMSVISNKYSARNLKQAKGPAIDRYIDKAASGTEAGKALKTHSEAPPSALPASMQKDLEKYTLPDATELKSQAMEKVTEQAVDYFQGHESALREAQDLMSQLKRKYSSVPDSRDMSTAVKINSLKETPFKKRLVYGTNFQLIRGNPISIDLAPNVMYRFNKLFSAGFGGTYRASLGIKDKMSPALAQDVFGLNALARHQVYKGFFAYGEFQYLNTPYKNKNKGTDLESRVWNKGLLAGIGKQMQSSKAVSGQMILTYDFLHNAQSPYPKAWNIKFGVQVYRFSLKGLNI